MKWMNALIWFFTIAAFAFLFFSFRSAHNEILYTFIALGMWGVAFLLSKYKPGEKKKKT